jgi:hypothetical protein
LGLTLLIVFIWIFVKNGKRTGLLHAIIRIDTMVGIIAGAYLTVSSLFSLLP